MIVRCLTALALLFTNPLISGEKNLDPSELNARLAEAREAGEDWVKDPSLIAPALVGNWIVPGEEMASMKREVSSSTSGEDPTSGITVIVKEDGLLDDAVRRIDHRFAFHLQADAWTITEASVTYHDARPAYPLPETEDPTKAAAGTLLLRQAPSSALTAAARSAGIPDLAESTSKALEGDTESLNALLNLSLDLSDEARADYARLLYGLHCVFETPGFQRYLYFHLEEGAPMTVLDLIRKVEAGEL